MSFCLVLVVYRLPDFFSTFFIQGFKNAKSELFFVPKYKLSKAPGY